LQNSDYGDAIQTFERLEPEDIGRDMAFLVGIIAILLPKFFLSIHTTCLEKFLIGYIGTDGSGKLSIRIGNDFRTSPVKIDLTVLLIWLVVLSSPSQNINR
jgi:hypothetical protein